MFLQLWVFLLQLLIQIYLSWITDREVKKEVYETVAFIKERKAEVTSGKYGMTQIVLKPNLEVYTMSPQNFFNTYQRYFFK